MAKELILGDNCNVYLGTVLIGCARKVKLTVKSDKLDVTCAGSGKVKQYKPGKQEITFSLEGLWKQYDNTEEATNVSLDDWFAGIVADTQVTLVFKPSTATETMYTVVGYAESVDMEANDGATGSYNVSGYGNSIAKAAVPSS